MKFTDLRDRRIVTVVTLATVGVFAAGALAGAATTSNTFTGCLKADGTIFNVKVGSTPLRPCETPKGQKQISWNEQGEQGPQGEQGLQGASGVVEVQQIVGNATETSPAPSTIDLLGHWTSSTDYVDIADRFTVTTDVKAGDRLSMQFQANTAALGTLQSFQYFTFNINGEDVATGHPPGTSIYPGGIAAIYNVPTVGSQGAGRVNIEYLWQATEDGTVTIKPRQKVDGTPGTQVGVIDNGDINPIFSVTTYG